MDILTTSSDQLRTLREKLEANSEFGLDYETSSSHPHPDAALHVDKAKVVGFGVGFLDGEKTYVPLAHLGEGNADYWEAVPLLEKVLTDKSKQVWAHNAQFEMKMTRATRIDFQCQWRDSMLLQHLLGLGIPGDGGLKLKAAVKEYLGHTMIAMDEVLPLGGRFHEVSPEKTGPYCADDALQCLRLGELWSPAIAESGQKKVFEEISCAFAHVLMHMEEVGIRLNPDTIRGLRDPWRTDADKLKVEFGDLVGVDIGSDAAISDRMFKELKWWPTDESWMGKHRYSVAAPVRNTLLERVPKGTPGYRALELKNEYSTLQKLLSTYTDSLISAAALYEDGRIRAYFSQAGTVTGRLSCSGPNLQNIPARGMGQEIRAGFEAEEGWVLSDADYSQAELIIMAHLSKDPMLLKAYREGLDVHQQTADYCRCDRGTGKVVNLGLIYEMQPATLASALGCSIEEATRIHTAWHKLYPKIKKYHEAQHIEAREKGFVRTVTGRIGYLPNINSPKFGLRLGSERASSNYPCQGSVADVLMIAMRNLLREWRSRGILYDIWTKQGKAKIVSQVHDEGIFELRHDFREEGMADIKRHMEAAVRLDAPMKAVPGCGKTWNDAKEDGKRREKAA